MAKYRTSGATAGAVGGIMGAIPGLNIIAPGLAQTIGSGDADALRGQYIDEARDLELPEFDKRDFSQIEYAGDFRPEAFATPEAASYQTINVDPRTREIAMQALQRMQGFVDQNATSQHALDRQSALDDAAQMARAREGAIAAQAARRGQGGSSLEYVMRNQAAQQGAQQAQGGMLNAAAQAALQRLMGNQAQMQGAMGLRGQDADIEGRNAAIINAFNMYNTQARNAANQANVEARNAAGLRNVDTRQGLAGQNTGIRNAGLLRNDQNVMNRFGAASTRLGHLGNALGGAAAGAAQGARDARAAGKEGYENFKDLMSFGAGGMGGV